MLKSKQRAKLRALSNPIGAIFQVGKGGVNEQLIRQIDETLEKRELIKVTVLESSPQSAREAAEMIAAATSAELVDVIGFKFILYRESKDNKSIILEK